MSLEQSRHICELFERGMQKLLAELRPERAFLAYREKSQTSAPFPTPYVVHGFSLANLFTTEDLSTEIVRNALASGEASLLADAMNAPHLNSRASVLISGLRSVLTVPLRHSSGLVLGLIYADSRVAAGAFHADQLEIAKSLGEKMVAPLSTVEKRMRNEASPVVLEMEFEDLKSKALALQKEQRGPEAIDLLEAWAKGRAPSTELGMAHGVRGRILEQSGKLEQALEALSASIWMLGRKATGPDERYSLMMNNLAGVQVTLGYFERAEGLLKSSLEHWRRLDLPGGRQLEGLAATSYNLGMLHQKRGQLAEAIPWMTRALEASEKAFGTEHPKSQKVRAALDGLRAEI
jgi:tetratricopeptide (TPR) repeat protein